MKKVLLVEDDITIHAPLSEHLSRSGFSVTIAQSLAEAKNHSPDQFDILLVDWQLPDGEGIDYIKWVRAKKTHLPILMLTARVDTEDKVLGLELGADDYITKPFELRELIARIRARLRHDTQPATRRLHVHKIELRLDSREVFFENSPIGLTKMEFNLLHFLILNIGKVLQRDEILNQVWGFENFPSSRTVDTHILSLRQKLGADLIETVRGIGYRMKDERK